MSENRIMLLRSLGAERFTAIYQKCCGNAGVRCPSDVGDAAFSRHISSMIDDAACTPRVVKNYRHEIGLVKCRRAQVEAKQTTMELGLQESTHVTNVGTLQPDGTLRMAIAAAIAILQLAIKEEPK